MIVFDKEVQRRINFFQKEYNCIMLITEIDGYYVMDICFNDTWEIVRNIKLSAVADNKYKLMKAFREYLKNR